MSVASSQSHCVSVVQLVSGAGSSLNVSKQHERCISSQAHLHMFTSVHIQTSTSSHLRISLSLSLFPALILILSLLPSFSFCAYIDFLLRPGGSADEAQGHAALSHEMRAKCKKTASILRFKFVGGNPFARNACLVSKTDGSAPLNMLFSSALWHFLCHHCTV